MRGERRFIQAFAFASFRGRRVVVCTRRPTSHNMSITRAIDRHPTSIYNNVSASKIERDRSFLHS